MNPYDLTSQVIEEEIKAGKLRTPEEVAKRTDELFVFFTEQMEQGAGGLQQGLMRQGQAMPQQGFNPFEMV